MSKVRIAIAFDVEMEDVSPEARQSIELSLAGFKERLELHIDQSLARVHQEFPDLKFRWGYEGDEG